MLSVWYSLHRPFDITDVRSLGRKRKVKCVFEADNVKCLTCTARGTKCMTQTKVLWQNQGQATITTASKDISLEERVAQLEVLLISQASRGNSVSIPQDGNASHETPNTSDNPEGHQRNSEKASDISEYVSSVHTTSFASPVDISTPMEPVGSLFNNAIVSILLPLLHAGLLTGPASVEAKNHKRGKTRSLFDRQESSGLLCK